MEGNLFNSDKCADARGSLSIEIRGENLVRQAGRQGTFFKCSNSCKFLLLFATPKWTTI